MKTIDACGISCPGPLLMLKEALGAEKEITLLVDSKNARENCESYAKKEGFSVETTGNQDRYSIYVTKTK